MGAKFFRFGWDYLDGLDEIRPGSLEEVRVLLRFVGTSQLPDPLQTFFTMALAPFCDPALPAVDRPGPLPILTGNVLYRLSDLVSEERRGLLTLFTHESGICFSLQDWRDVWLAQFQKGEESIPRFPGGDPIELPGLRDGR